MVHRKITHLTWVIFRIVGYVITIGQNKVILHTPRHYLYYKKLMVLKI